MIYVAMFDEVNEGTAIFKISDDQDLLLPRLCKGTICLLQWCLCLFLDRVAQEDCH